MEFKVLDLFCGAGGFSAGLEQVANFTTEVGLDFDKYAIETFTKNFPNAASICGDILNQDVKNRVIQESRRRKVNMVVGGPPCQGFSLKGKNLGLNDSRNFLFKEYLNIVKELQPEVFIIENVKNIVRKHMNEAGAQEVTMPLLLPIEAFEKSGRYSAFGPSIFQLRDRYDRPYVLGPTHEEFFVLAAMMKAKSYKDFPYTLYQVGNKYRDEIRPRLGLIRTREFTMKDAYSFDVDQKASDISYQKQFEAYHKICREVGLNYVVVRADTGVMGGLLSEEFQAITNVGEDILVLCDQCDYASNREVSKCEEIEKTEKEAKKPIEKVHTPSAGTIEQVSEFLQEKPEKFVKTLIYKADDKFYACLVPGDREINEVKLTKLLKTSQEVTLAEEQDVERITNAKIGFAGPVGISIPVIMDKSVAQMQNFIVGANETDYHYKNVNVEDFKVELVADIKNIQEGDLCPHCHKGHVYFKKGIE